MAKVTQSSRPAVWLWGFGVQLPGFRPETCSGTSLSCSCIEIPCAGIFQNIVSHNLPVLEGERGGGERQKQSERVGELEREKKGKQFPSPSLASGLLSSLFSCYIYFFNFDLPGSPLQVSNVVWIPQWSKPLDQIAKSKYCHSLINIKGSAVNFLVLKMIWPRKMLAQFHDGTLLALFCRNSGSCSVS